MKLPPSLAVCTVVFAMAVVTAHVRPGQALGDPAKSVAAPARIDAQGDPLPEGALFRFGSLRYRHADGINAAAISPNGKLLATAAKTSVAIWDLDTGERLKLLRDAGMADGFGGAGGKVVFGPDGNTVISLCQGATEASVPGPAATKPVYRGELAKVWDVKSGGLLFSLVGERGYHAIVMYPTGSNQIVTSSARVGPNPDITLRFWDSMTGKELRDVKIDHSIYALSPNHRYVVGASEQRALLLDLPVAKELAQFEVPGGLSSAGIHSDGRYVATLAKSGELCIWDIDHTTGKAVVNLTVPGVGKPQTPACFLFARDGKGLYMGGHDGNIRRFDTVAKTELPPLKGHKHWVTSLHFTNGDKNLISTSWDLTIRRWDLATGQELPLSDGYVLRTVTAFAPDGGWYAVANGAGRVDLWSPQTGKRMASLREHGPAVTRLACSPDGKLLAAGQRDATIQLWEMPAGKTLEPIRVVTANQDDQRMYFRMLAFSPDARALIANVEQLGFRAWDVAARQELWQLSTKESVGAFSPDGKQLVTAGWDPALSVRDPATGKERKKVSVRHGTDAVKFSPDGKQLAFSQRDGTIRLCDAESHTEKTILKGHQEVVWCVAFSRDSKWLASGGLDHTVRIWETVTGAEVLKLEGHDSWVMEVAFGRDGKTVLSNADLAPLLWTLRPKDVPPLPADLESVWSDLASDDAAKVYRWQWALLETPAVAAEWFAKKLAAAKGGLDRVTFDRLVNDLDSGQFRVREAAQKSLADFGPLARPWLQESLEKSESLEAKRRLKEILVALKTEPGPHDRRILRAVQVLELAATPETKQLLQTWAAGAAGALLTEQAKSALARLKRH